MLRSDLDDAQMRTTPAAIFAVTVLAASPSWAASDQASFGVSARVESVCTVGDRQARVEVRCTRGTSYILSFGAGHVEPVSADGAERVVAVSNTTGVVTATITY